MIISVANQKGGVGKTTTSQALGAGLIENGYKVLMIDLDPQSNLSTALNADSDKPSIYNVLKREILAKDAIQQVSNYDIITSNIMLSAADMEFVSIGRESILKEVLSTINDEYDFIVIDTPPALGILTTNAFVASDKLVIPAEADIFSLQGLSQLNLTIQQIKKYVNNSLEIAGVLLTKHNAKTNIAKDVTGAIQEHVARVGTKLYKTTIRNSVAIREAQITQSDIIDYAPYANAQLDYKKWVKEFLKDCK